MVSPRAPRPEGSAVAVIGFPGAGHGPDAIRAGSAQLRGWNANLHVDVPTRLGIVDVGDVDDRRTRGGAGAQRPAECLGEIVRAGAVPLCLSDRPGVLPSILDVVAEAHGPTCLVRFDAHPAGRHDAARTRDEPLGSSGTVWAGVRGSFTAADEPVVATAGELVVLTYEELVAVEAPGFSERVHGLVGLAPCVVSFDLDFVDAAFAPGTSSPAVAGPSSRDALTFVRAIAGLRFCAFECVGLDTRFDPSGVTALLAATVCFELLSLLALQR